MVLKVRPCNVIITRLLDVGLEVRSFPRPSYTVPCYILIGSALQPLTGNPRLPPKEDTRRPLGVGLGAPMSHSLNSLKGVIQGMIWGV